MINLITHRSRLFFPELTLLVWIIFKRPTSCISTTETRLHFTCKCCYSLLLKGADWVQTLLTSSLLQLDCREWSDTNLFKIFKEYRIKLCNIITHHGFPCLAKTQSDACRTHLLLLFMQNLLISLLLFLFDNSKLNIVFLSRVKQDLLGHLDLLWVLCIITQEYWFNGDILIN